MTAPTITPFELGAPGPAFFLALEHLHGHRCPMSILGARLGFAALSAVESLGDPDRRLRARYHNRNCALDGIQLATRCSLGNGQLEVVEVQEHRLVLWAEGDPRRAEGCLTPAALERGRRYSELRTRAERLAPGEPAERELREEMRALLQALESAPEKELVAVTMGSV